MQQSDATPPSTSEEILDSSTMKQLLDLDDGELGLIQEMCQLFIEDMPPRILAMEAAIRAGQGEEMADVAHAVKGAASTMGVPGVRNVALALETLGRTGTGTEPADILLARMKVEYERAHGALQAFIIAKGGRV